MGGRLRDEDVVLIAGIHFLVYGLIGFMGMLQSIVSPWEYRSPLPRWLENALMFFGLAFSVCCIVLGVVLLVLVARGEVRLVEG